ncbi:MAG: acyl-CoA synthetase [Gammaproteobacteria bacterium SG8_31]|nr:MAG: acyl-CoA synthetase [Gammaproteobacteria bacterium SG8_31]
MVPTPTDSNQPLRPANFAGLAEALDYAAQGEAGANFYDGRGNLQSVLPYSVLSARARAAARRMRGLGLERGARVALVAETTPDFLIFFFACQYAGVVPVPLTAAITLGSRIAYVEQLHGLLENSSASMLVAPTGYESYFAGATEGLDLKFCGTPEEFAQLPEADVELQPLTGKEIAYIQYTSGSTRFPRGVLITEEAVLENLKGIIKHGIKVQSDDRFFSWLPFYHDMGLIGLVLTPVASQTSVDYLGTREFAMRPRLWLELLTRTRCTISFGPPFGYELCARRLREGDTAKYDLSNWRIAGVGAEMIRADVLHSFAEALEPSGFREDAFLPCYGMAECSLAISFSALDEPVREDVIDSEHLSNTNEAIALDGSGDSSRARSFVNCGVPLPDYEVEIRDSEGRKLPDRCSGTIFVRGPSVMSGYFNEPEITAQTLSADGWLNTGDVGYRVGASIVITGRQKDIIIINGRNIWPQDLEYLAEQQPEVRTGDALAFSAPAPDGSEVPVLVVQCRLRDDERRADLIRRLERLVGEEHGIHCQVQLVPAHFLPRTSSGKLSRSKARQNYIDQLPPAHGFDVRELERAAG